MFIESDSEDIRRLRSQCSNLKLGIFPSVKPYSGRIYKVLSCSKYFYLDGNVEQLIKLVKAIFNYDSLGEI